MNLVTLFLLTSSSFTKMIVETIGNDTFFYNQNGYLVRKNCKNLIDDSSSTTAYFLDYSTESKCPYVAREETTFKDSDGRITAWAETRIVLIGEDKYTVFYKKFDTINIEANAFEFTQSSGIPPLPNRHTSFRARLLE